MVALNELTSAERHRAVSAGLTEHAAAVREWDAPTPVHDWVARDVIAHLIGWFADFLSAGGVDLPAGPPIDDDPFAAWLAHTEDVQALLDGEAAAVDFSHPMV